jgi:hypothetical protein
MDDLRFVIGVDDRDLIRAQKEQKKYERNVLIIEQALRKGQITSSRYASELNKQASSLSKLGGTYKKANSEIRTYSSSVRKLTDDQLRMAQATNMAGKSTNRFGMYAQQVGYQVGDFFVQVQSGTSALVAFGQQGTQLAGLLPGVAGAVIGISLAVGTMLARSFMEARKATNASIDALVTYQDAMKVSAEKTRDLRLENFQLANSIKSVAKAKLMLAIQDIEEKKSQRGERTQRRGFQSGDRLVTKGGRVLVEGYEGQLEKLKAQLKALDSELETNVALTEGIRKEEERLDLLREQERLRERIMRNLIEEAHEVFKLEGLEGEKLFIAKQELEVRKLLIELEKAGVGGFERQHHDAVKLLESMQEVELRTYRQIEAEKAHQELLKERAKLQDKINKAVLKATREIEKEQKKFADGIANSFGDAFTSMVDGTKSVKDAFKDMARDIIKQLYQVLVVEQMVASISGAIQGAMGGGMSSPAPQIRPFADGGVVNSPTTFPMSGGRTGLMGEAGPEAIMPLKRGANGKLGVQMEGGATTTVVQNFNFSANGDESVKRIIAQAAPKIAQMTKSEIINDRRRGGTMKATFG